MMWTQIVCTYLKHYSTFNYLKSLLQSYAWTVRLLVSENLIAGCYCCYLIIIVDISFISACRCYARFPLAIVGASTCNGVRVTQASSPDVPSMATSVSTRLWEERPQASRRARSQRHSLLILSHSRCHTQLPHMNRKRRWWRRHQSGCGDQCLLTLP